MKSFVTHVKIPQVNRHNCRFFYLLPCFHRHESQLRKPQGASCPKDGEGCWQSVEMEKGHHCQTQHYSSPAQRLQMMVRPTFHSNLVAVHCLWQLLTPIVQHKNTNQDNIVNIIIKIIKYKPWTLYVSKGGINLNNVVGHLFQMTNKITSLRVCMTHCADKVSKIKFVNIKSVHKYLALESQTSC